MNPFILSRFLTAEFLSTKILYSAYDRNLSHVELLKFISQTDSYEIKEIQIAKRKFVIEVFLVNSEFSVFERNL